MIEVIAGRHFATTVSLANLFVKQRQYLVTADVTFVSTYYT